MKSKVSGIIIEGFEFWIGGLYGGMVLDRIVKDEISGEKNHYIGYDKDRNTVFDSSGGSVILLYSKEV